MNKVKINGNVEYKKYFVSELCELVKKHTAFIGHLIYESDELYLITYDEVVLLRDSIHCWPPTATFYVKKFVDLNIEVEDEINYE